MDNCELQDFNKRINLNTDLDNISKIICEKYNIGTFISNELITIGYEDYNYYLISSNGKYVVKIFNKNKNDDDINDYLDRLRIISESNLNTNFENVKYNICVFEFIDGKNFYELNIKPSKNEIKELAKQVSIINNLPLNISFVYDDWAIINFEKEYSIKRKYLNKNYQDEFDKLLIECKNINFDLLPIAFVHGDIINTNVIKDNNSKLWIIDFSVSNILPRIIDLAVISCNLCLDEIFKH